MFNTCLSSAVGEVDIPGFKMKMYGKTPRQADTNTNTCIHRHTHTHTHIHAHTHMHTVTHLSLIHI